MNDLPNFIDANLCDRVLTQKTRQWIEANIDLVGVIFKLGNREALRKQMAELDPQKIAVRCSHPVARQNSIAVILVRADWLSIQSSHVLTHDGIKTLRVHQKCIVPLNGRKGMVVHPGAASP